MNFQGGYNDGFEEVTKKIKNSQGLIAAGPVYWGTVRAQLMTAFLVNKIN